MPFRDLSKIDGLNVLRDVPLAPLTTFRIGGKARVFVRPMRLSALEAAMSYMQGMGLSFRILGRGSNILIDDRGVDIVLSLAGLVDVNGPIELEDRVSILTAGAGCSLGMLISWAVNRGLSGLEGLCGIPGSLGGVVRMNAGTRLGDIGSVLHSVCFTGPGGSYWTPKEALELGYRSLNTPNGAVISAARLRLTPRKQSDILKDIRSIMKKRRMNQPLGRPSAGCIFKNPSDIPAGKLIDMCGLKGFAVGGAQVSPIHANFIVNNGNASFSDVTRLMGIVKDRVLSTSGIELIPEVTIWRMEQ
ncbi:MAG: UDP-N-acetylmuramate dehydrogenase [Dissulfurimicrobium sp.]|uniref:UDP-N-acetylmuramate dehydrogenase n=1 Tax=Dissulfurimicrobium sp. TaxID=2022436 RepID=UPI004049BA47